MQSMNVSVLPEELIKASPGGEWVAEGVGLACEECVGVRSWLCVAHIEVSFSGEC